MHLSVNITLFAFQPAPYFFLLIQTPAVSNSRTDGQVEIGPAFPFRNGPNLSTAQPTSSCLKSAAAHLQVRQISVNGFSIPISAVFLWMKFTLTVGHRVIHLSFQDVVVRKATLTDRHKPIDSPCHSSLSLMRVAIKESGKLWSRAKQSLKDFPSSVCSSSNCRCVLSVTVLCPAGSVQQLHPCTGCYSFAPNKKKEKRKRRFLFLFFLYFAIVGTSVRILT